MLDALVVGTRDAEVLAELVRGRLRTKIPALTLALVGRFGGGVPYHELGGDYLNRNSPQRRARKHLNDLRALGWTITQSPHGVTCTPPEAA